jgi:hypothetical protein
MKKLFEFFRSVRTAIALMAIIVILSILSTLIPQGRDDEYYRSNYPPFLFGLLQVTRLQHFSSSLLFLIPTALFMGSLGVCTVDRMAKRFRSRALPRHGPDLIHVGLLVLAAGALLTSFMRKETDFNMAVGDEVEISGGYRLALLAFDYLRYEDGRPKSWTSTVKGTRNGKIEAASFPIQVNKPLRMGTLAIYQVNYGGIVHLLDAEGNTTAMMTGQWIEGESSTIVLAALEKRSQGGGALDAVVEEWKGGVRVTSAKVPQGSSIGPYRVMGMAEFTGLRAVDDPGAIPVIAALLICSLGLVLTFVQKKGAMKS